MTVKLVLSTSICDIGVTLKVATSTYTVSNQDIHYLDEGVYSYGAVYRGLHCINTGDYVKYTQDNQVRHSNDHFSRQIFTYTYLQEMLGILAYFKCLRTEKDVCIINPFDRLIAGDEAVHNDLDCPLLMFTQNLSFIPFHR